jgi:hypothetical protein
MKCPMCKVGTVLVDCGNRLKKYLAVFFLIGTSETYPDIDIRQIGAGYAGKLAPLRHAAQSL